jgi:DNA-binding GntR family transcriptional regulator
MATTSVTGHDPTAIASPPGDAAHARRRRSRPLLADVVRAQLRRAILSGEFGLGSKLPNEEQLCDRFGVSRVTVREAVRGLIEEGYVVRRQGSGTYVTRRPSLRNSLDTTFSYTEFIEASGLHAGKQVLGAKMVAADQTVAEALDLPVGSQVAEIRRTRTADRQPAIYSIDYLPSDIIDSIDPRDRFRESVYRLLSDLGHPIDHAEAILEPVIADPDLARILDVAKGAPLQHLRQIDYDASGRPVMWSLEWHVPAVIELRVYRRGPGPLAGGAGKV